MKKTIILLAFSLLYFGANAQTSVAPTQKNPDAFQEMMSILNISGSNLGYIPKGYWTRYPVPQDIPYKMISFDGLLAEPHRIYDFVRNMALSADDFLNPEYSKTHNDGLLKIVFYCGIQHVTSQFRCYNASLWAEIDSTEPLLMAIKEIYMKTGSTYRYHRFGEAADFPLIEKDLRNAIKPIHPEVRKVVARCVLHLTEAYRFRQIAMRNVDWKKANDCWRIRHIGETEFDGMHYYPELEDCARNLDLNSIYYSGYKMLQSSVELADTLIALKTSGSGIDWDGQNLNVITPIGRIVLAGNNDDTHEYSDALLVVDMGGNDVYKGATGSTPSLNIPISLSIDLEGDDKYINNDEFLPSQGAAMFGAGMLLDISGDDEYRSKRLSQGAAMLGIGILADLDGNDKYEMWTSGQGGAYFGVGIAIDNSGDDVYKIWGDGQGYGGVGGAGALINRTGNDHYWAEIESKNVFRPDYHSKDGEHNYTYVQGSGVGRRGDITDGHSWAGGIGTIIDLEGNDIYESGNWSQACGYWYGMGFLYDGGGDDRYISTTWSQACGAHFCISAFIDEGGDDEHIIWEQQGVGMGFGHDYTVALFLNRGGDDFYKVKDDGLGFAINMSQVFFFDTDGNDEYIRGGKGHNYGWNNFTAHNPPDVGSMYHLYSDQICLFGDLGGTDVYKIMDFESGEESIDSSMKDGSVLFFPTAAERDSLANKRFYGLGKDFVDWNGPQIEYFRDKMKRMFPKGE